MECWRASHYRISSVYDFGIFLRLVFFYDQIVYDEILSLHSVLAHVVFEQLFHLVCLAKRDSLQTDVLPNEMLELFRRNLSQSFKSRYLRVGTECLYSVHSFVFAVSIHGDEVAFAFLVL